LHDEIASCGYAYAAARAVGYEEYCKYFLPYYPHLRHPAAHGGNVVEVSDEEEEDSEDAYSKLQPKTKNKQSKKHPGAKYVLRESEHSGSLESDEESGDNEYERDSAAENDDASQGSPPPSSAFRNKGKKKARRVSSSSESESSQPKRLSKRQLLGDSDASDEPEKTPPQPPKGKGKGKGTVPPSQASATLSQVATSPGEQQRRVSGRTSTSKK
jgi:hypothetical protein